MIAIRAATRDDLPGILQIYNEAVRNSTATYDYEPDTLEGRSRWLDEHERDGYPVFVAADDDGRVIGWSSLGRFRSKMGYRFTAENSIYVANDRRGQGIGRMLMEPLIDAARERSVHAIVAGIDADSVASMRLHESFGFQRVAHFREVGCKFGRWLDVVFMELIVTP